MSKTPQRQRPTFTDQEALLFHSAGRPGELGGLGNRGALAAKPVMEGKAVLFKRFADIDAIDLEVSTEDPDEFINCVRFLGAGWGGINLEDIKAPECFIIEQKLRERM